MPSVVEVIEKHPTVARVLKKTQEAFKGGSRGFVCGNSDCGKVGPWKRCGNCHLQYYCSEECQRNDWPNHKRWCSDPRKLGHLVGEIFADEAKVAAACCCGGKKDGEEGVARSAGTALTVIANQEEELRQIAESKDGFLGKDLAKCDWDGAGALPGVRDAFQQGEKVTETGASTETKKEQYVAGIDAAAKMAGVMPTWEGTAWGEMRKAASRFGSFASAIGNTLWDTLAAVFDYAMFGVWNRPAAVVENAKATYEAVRSVTRIIVAKLEEAYAWFVGGASDLVEKISRTVQSVGEAVFGDEDLSQEAKFAEEDFESLFMPLLRVVGSTMTAVLLVPKMVQYGASDVVATVWGAIGGYVSAFFNHACPFLDAAAKLLRAERFAPYVASWIPSFGAGGAWLTWLKERVAWLLRVISSHAGALISKAVQCMVPWFANLFGVDDAASRSRDVLLIARTLLDSGTLDKDTAEKLRTLLDALTAICEARAAEDTARTTKFPPAEAASEPPPNLSKWSTLKQTIANGGTVFAETCAMFALGFDSEKTADRAARTEAALPDLYDAVASPAFKPWLQSALKTDASAMIVQTPEFQALEDFVRELTSASLAVGNDTPEEKAAKDAADTEKATQDLYRQYLAGRQRLLNSPHTEVAKSVRRQQERKKVRSAKWYKFVGVAAEGVGMLTYICSTAISFMSSVADTVRTAVEEQKKKVAEALSAADDAQNLRELEDAVRLSDAVRQSGAQMENLRKEEWFIKAMEQKKEANVWRSVSAQIEEWGYNPLLYNANVLPTIAAVLQGKPGFKCPSGILRTVSLILDERAKYPMLGRDHALERILVPGFWNDVNLTSDAAFATALRLLGDQLTARDSDGRLGSPMLERFAVVTQKLYAAVGFGAVSKAVVTSVGSASIAATRIVQHLVPWTTVTANNVDQAAAALARATSDLKYLRPAAAANALGVPWTTKLRALWDVMWTAGGTVTTGMFLVPALWVGSLAAVVILVVTSLHAAHAWSQERAAIARNKGKLQEGGVYVTDEVEKFSTFYLRFMREQGWAYVKHTVLLAVAIFDIHFVHKILHMLFFRASKKMDYAWAALEILLAIVSSVVVFKIVTWVDSRVTEKVD